MKHFLSRVKLCGLTGWFSTLLGILCFAYAAVYKHSRGYAVLDRLPALRTDNLKLTYLCVNFLGWMSVVALVIGMLLLLNALLRANNPPRTDPYAPRPSKPRRK